jgi:hypothetical protein
MTWFYCSNVLGSGTDSAGPMSIGPGYIDYGTKGENLWMKMVSYFTMRSLNSNGTLTTLQVHWWRQDTGLGFAGVFRFFCPLSIYSSIRCWQRIKLMYIGPISFLWWCLELLLLPCPPVRFPRCSCVLVSILED